MTNLSYKWTELTPLAVELSRPLKQVSVEFEPHGWPMFTTLWRSDGTGLRVHSEMHDVAERREVGVLCFNYVSVRGRDETVVDVASKFDCPITPYKLIIHESGTSAESGVTLKASVAGDEIVIVPSANPYRLAIRGVLSSVPHIFEPEYALDRYVRVPFIQN